MRTIRTSGSLGPVTWFIPAVKSLYVTQSENSPELHAHIKREPESPPPPQLPSATRICRLGRNCPDGWVDAADVCIPELWIMRRVVKLLRRRLFAGTTLTGGHGAGRISRYSCCRSICVTIKSLRPQQDQVASEPKWIPTKDPCVMEMGSKKKKKTPSSQHVASLFNDITRSQLTSCRLEWRPLSPHDVGSYSLPYILNHFSY